MQIFWRLCDPFWFAIWTSPFKLSNILITISWSIQDIVIKMFDHFKGQVCSYGKSKPSENLKLINFHVCNLILSENWTYIHFFIMIYNLVANFGTHPLQCFCSSLKQSLWLTCEGQCACAEKSRDNECQGSACPNV